MTRLECDKTSALALLRIPDCGFGAVLIKNLAWRMHHEPAAPLSRKEKYLLELCCWHYRKALGGLVTFELPTAKPAQAAFMPVREPVQRRFF